MRHPLWYNGRRRLFAFVKQKIIIVTLLLAPPAPHAYAKNNHRHTTTRRLRRSQKNPNANENHSHLEVDENENHSHLEKMPKKSESGFLRPRQFAYEYKFHKCGAGQIKPSPRIASRMSALSSKNSFSLFLTLGKFKRFLIFANL